MAMMEIAKINSMSVNAFDPVLDPVLNLNPNLNLNPLRLLGGAKRL
jgi:hypothetical protein